MVEIIILLLQAEYELQCNEVLGWRKRAPTVEGFTKEVNALCDPSATSVLHTLVQDKYRSLPCSIRVCHILIFA